MIPPKNLPGGGVRFPDQEWIDAQKRRDQWAVPLAAFAFVVIVLFGCAVTQ